MLRYVSAKGSPGTGGKKSPFHETEDPNFGPEELNRNEIAKGRTAELEGERKEFQMSTQRILRIISKLILFALLLAVPLVAQAAF
jgi:hypothetical protein